MRKLALSVVASVVVVCGFAGVAQAARGDGLTELLGETGSGMLIIAAGLFSVAGGALGWPWFMNHRKAQLFVRVLGYNGARGLYVVLGVIICVCGVMVLAGKSMPQDANAASKVTRTR